MKLYNTMTREEKKSSCLMEEGKVKHVCVWSDRIQFHPHRKRKTDDCFRYGTPLF